MSLQSSLSEKFFDALDDVGECCSRVSMLLVVLISFISANF